MQTIAIISGNLSNTGKNFTGYNATGTRIHIPLRQMENLYPNFSKDTKVEFPLYGLVVEREFDEVDENNQPTGVKFKRLQTGSLFKTKVDMIAAANADKLLTIETAADLKTQANVAGLNEETINALLSVV